jgi:hypothetical protein
MKLLTRFRYTHASAVAAESLPPSPNPGSSKRRRTDLHPPTRCWTCISMSSNAAGSFFAGSYITYEPADAAVAVRNDQTKRSRPTKASGQFRCRTMWSSLCSCSSTRHLIQGRRCRRNIVLPHVNRWCCPAVVAAATTTTATRPRLSSC